MGKRPLSLLVSSKSRPWQRSSRADDFVFAHEQEQHFLGRVWAANRTRCDLKRSRDCRPWTYFSTAPMVNPAGRLVGRSFNEWTTRSTLQVTQEGHHLHQRHPCFTGIMHSFSCSPDTAATSEAALCKAFPSGGLPIKHALQKYSYLLTFCLINLFHWIYQWDIFIWYIYYK